MRWSGFEIQAVARSRKRLPRNGKGFVLLATVILLGLVAVLMLGLSRRSVARASEALDARAALQWKWGAATTRAVVLPRAERLLKEENRAAAQGRDGVVSEMRVELELGGWPVAVTVADEQAKASVNTLWGRLEEERLERVVRELLPEGVGGSVVKLRPDEGAPKPDRQRARKRKWGEEGQSAQGEQQQEGGEVAGVAFEEPEAPLGAPAFGSWGQVFEGATAEELFGALDEDEEAETLTSRMTCWGDGRLHLRYASKETIEAVFTELLTDGQIRRILSNRTEKPEEPGEWLAGVELTDEQRPAVMRLIAPRSRCHSVTIAGDDGWRVRYEQAIREDWSPPESPEASPPPTPEAAENAPPPEGAPPAEQQQQPPASQGPKERYFRLVW